MNNLKGTLVATTTAAPLSTTTNAIQDVLIQNDPVNTVNVLVGNATTQNIKLVPGASASIEIDNVTKIFVKTESGTATVNYMTGGA